MDKILQNNFNNFKTTSTDMMVDKIANPDKLNDELIEFKRNSPKENPSEKEVNECLNDLVDAVNKSEQFTEKKNTNDVGIGGNLNNNITGNLNNNTNNNNNKIEDENEQLAKLDMLRQLGDLRENYNIRLSQKYSMTSDYKTMKYEYELHKSRIEKKQTMAWLSSSLVNICWGIEICNQTFDPFGFKLGGWHESVQADQENYTGILSDLYEKYFKSGRAAPPEIKLILTLLGSAITFHIGRNAANSMPDLNDMLNSDPNLREKLRDISNNTNNAQNQNQNQNQNKPTTNVDKEQENIMQKMKDLEMLRETKEKYDRMVQQQQQQQQQQQYYAPYNDMQSTRSARTDELYRKLLEKDNHIKSLQDQLDMARSEIEINVYIKTRYTEIKTYTRTKNNKSSKYTQKIC